MSRSYKKQPFMAICGDSSAKKDKQLAHRGERRRHSQAIKVELKSGGEFEEFVPPLRPECTHNNVYSWNRDGKQHYQQPTCRDRQDFLNGEDTWPPQWYKDMMRK